MEMDREVPEQSRHQSYASPELSRMLKSAAGQHWDEEEVEPEHYKVVRLRRKETVSEERRRKGALQSL